MRAVAKHFALTAAMLLAAVRQAAFASITYDVQLDQSLFGHVNQNNVPARGPGSPGSMSCAPTAVANSMQYLQNAFPTNYGANTLIPSGHTAQDVAIDLANNWMNTTNSMGTSGESAIEGKRQYMESA